MAMLVAPEQNGTIYYLLMRPWLQFFGTDPFALRYFSVLTGAITIALMWQVARRMVPAVGSTFLRNLPLLSTLFLAANPYQLWYSRRAEATRSLWRWRCCPVGVGYRRCGTADMGAGWAMFYSPPYPSIRTR